MSGACQVRCFKNKSAVRTIPSPVSLSTHCHPKCLQESLMPPFQCAPPETSQRNTSLLKSLASSVESVLQVHIATMVGHIIDWYVANQD